ncbi:MAG: isoleucine--tRNA ligase [Planctomycetota bacterium]
MYQEISGQNRQQDLEERILGIWREKNIFQRAQERRKEAPRYTFYEGPPTANGKPGIHHVLARTLKDVVCRYFDLSGKSVERKAGWDTHGLPVEVEVEKQLGIHGKDAINEYGVESFTRKCVDSVFTYVEQWEELTDRIGYWLDLKNAYVTYHESYVESVWWSLAELYRKGLLYKSHKVVWWWPQGGTALSAGEVGQGYREVEDPSITVRFRWKEEPIGGKPTSFLAWTTTPWTLPSNVALAVGAGLDYIAADLGDEVLVMAAALEQAQLKGKEYQVVASMKGADLAGKTYEPVFNFKVPENGRAWEVIAGDFVNIETGTGIVHLAPAFGEDDYRTAKENGLGFLQLVKPDGTFTEEVTGYAGRFIKDCDKELIRDLTDRGLLFSRSQYRHDYPFCWRKPEDALIQYARESWFVKTTQFRDRLLALNDTINWKPDHIQKGRFGNFLENNVDWALSRERFWGTPLPIWINDETGALDCVGSVAEILERNPGAFDAFDRARESDPQMASHLRVHKPWIDAITWTKEGEPGVYRRVPEVIDCWYDSGAMPFAQRHYPFENKELFEKSFPADFICEGLDQTRGWFYTLHAIATLCFDSVAYKNVIVNGLVNDKHGKKMSKTIGNTVDPWEVIAAHGADALRWFLLAGSPPWASKSFDVDSVGEVSRKIFGTLWPSFNFFARYANVDGWTAGTEAPPVSARGVMDRWLISRTHSLIREYREQMESYDPMRATRALGLFITDELSNWYIRRNRARFWKLQDPADKAAAYATLFEALETVAFLLAPVAPMSADTLYQALQPEGDGLDSVHLGDLPAADESLIDEQIERRMEAVLAVVALGRAARKESNLKVRQPLKRLIGAGPDRAALDGLLDEDLAREVREELNVKELIVADRAGEYCTVTIKPNLKLLGPKLGKRLPAVRNALMSLDDAAISEFESSGKVVITHEGEEFVLEGEELLIVRSGKAGFAVATGGGYLAALDTELSPELITEGHSREFINRIQNQRKDAGLEVTTRIRLRCAGAPEIMSAVSAWSERINGEVLALSTEVLPDRSALTDPVEWEIDGHAFWTELTAQ